jgi:ABC-2 type transport system permease protein
MFTLIFGVAFPILLSVLFSFIYSSDVPPGEIGTLNSSLYTTMIMIVPLATMFIGYAANYANEIESGSLQRFKLFGYKESTLLGAKLIANLVFFTAALLIYSAFSFIFLDIPVPNPWAFVTLIVFLYLLATALLILSHAIAAFMKRFGPTYGITMTLYFVFMIFGGMMGVKADRFPAVLRVICKAFPMYYASSGEFSAFWMGGGYNFLGMGLSMLGLFAVSCGLLALSVFFNKKGSKKAKKPKPVYWD